MKVLLFSDENNNILLSYFLPSFALAFLHSLLYNKDTKAREEKIMMIRSNKSRKFSFKYRIEKWFYEDSKTDVKKAALFILEGLSALLMFAALAILPALFH